MDQLAFVVETAFTQSDLRIRKRLQQRILTFSGRVRSDRTYETRSKTFWKPYLDSDVPMLCFEARGIHGLSIPGPMERVLEQEEWIATHAIDPKRREKAAEAIRIRELLKKLRNQ